MRRARMRRLLALVLLAWAALAAPASAEVNVAVGPMWLAFDPASGWSMVEARYEGEPVSAVPRGGSSGTTIRAGSGWAGELHGNLVVERVSVAVDDEPLARLPEDGALVVGQKRVRIERHLFLGGVARLVSVLTMSASSIVDQVTLQGVSPDTEVDFAYTHLATRANGLTRARLYDGGGALLLALDLDQDDGRLIHLPKGTHALELVNTATGLHVSTAWSQPNDDGFVIDRATDQKVYHRTRDLESGLGWVWSGTQTVHVWRP